MGIGLEQWRAKIGLWHAFTTGRPLVRRRRCKPLRGRSERRHECKRAFKARQKGRQKTEVRFQFLSFVAMLTLLIVVDSRINTLNNLSCRLTSTRFYPAIRLAATLFLVGSNKYGSIDKRRNTGMEPRSLISQQSVMMVLAMLLIVAGDVEVNPGPFKLEASTDLTFLCSLPLAAEWRNLGTRLLVPEHQLNTIHANHAYSPNYWQDCLKSMFAFWLNHCVESTCEFLIQAVDAMGKRDVVTMLCQKYRIVPPGALQSGGYSVGANLQQPQSGYQPTPGTSQTFQQGMHGFLQGAQFQQYVHQQPSIQPASQTVGQFGSYFSDTVQQQLAYSQQYGVRYLPPQQLHNANPQQQQSHLPPQSGQFTGESQGVSIPTTQQLMIELYHTVATEWHPIGMFLGISDGELKIIAERENDPQKCLMAMLSVWLCRTNPPASWPDIAKAVEFIKRPDLAQQIRQKYCVHAFQPSMQLPHQSQPQYAPPLAMQPTFQITGFATHPGHFAYPVGGHYPPQQPKGYQQTLAPFQPLQQEPQISLFEQIQQTPPRSQESETQASPPPPPSTLPPLSLQPAVVQSSPPQALSAASSDQKMSKAADFAHENRQAIIAKFADFQTKVCDKLFRNGVNTEQFHLFVTNQFPPGDCIPQPPASLTQIFKAITYHGLWDCLHYSPLVRIVQKFGANDTEMESWVHDYEKDLKAYTLVTDLEVYIEPDLENAAPSPAECAKYDRRYCSPVEWKTKFIDHSLQYLTDVWKMFSCRYLVPDSPPTALLDRVRKGCFSVTWLIPSHLIPSLVEKIKIDTDFFEQYRILRVTVGEECAYEEVIDGNTSESEQVELKDKAPLVLGGGAEPHGSPKVTDQKEVFGGYDCKFVEPPPCAFQTECPICRLLLRNPYQATCCGTSFCQTCSQRVKAANNCCPMCKEDNFEVSPNKGLKRSLTQLDVFCTHNKDGCKWKGELGQLEHHLNKVIHSAAQSSADVSNISEVDSIPIAPQSSADITDGSEVSSTPLDVYAENLKSRYRCRPKRKNIWPPQTTKKYFNLALIKEETVRKGEISDEFTRLTITGKVEDILRSKLPIKLEDVFKKTDDHQKMTILMEGCPGSGKTVLTQHLCLEWVHGKLFQDHKLVILVRLREPAVHNAKDIKEILPRVGTEENIAKEIESSRGRGVLFILDGWDELPEDVSGHDTIYNIVSGETLPECDAVITSRPTSSASLHDTELISSRIEILGFTPGELCEFFTEHLEGNASKANTLLQKIEANPIVAGTCALPLNAVILVHIFKQHGDLPTTEHGIFDALIRNCILRHVTERTHLKTKVIKSLTNLPPELKPQYHELGKIAYEGVIKDQVIFELDEDFNTLGLLQGVECYTGDGTQHFYNFLHLSIQEFLAAHFIATAFEPAEQVAKFDELFGQARFSSTFRHYSAITKLAITGIDKIVLRIVKRCAGDSSGDEDGADGADSSSNDSVSYEDKAHLLSLLNCLREAQEPPMYNLMADNLGSKLDLEDITLNLADCLSISYFLKYVTDFELKLDSCSIEADGIRMLFSQDQAYQIRALDLSRNEIGAEEAKALLAAMEKMVTLQELVLYNCEMGAEEIKLLSTGMEKMVHLQTLNLEENEIGPQGCEAIANGLKHCTKLEYLHLGSNKIGPEGAQHLLTALEKMVNLKKLHLEENEIGPEGVQHLLTAFEKMVNLQKLDLEENEIGSEGVQYLTALEKMVNLQKLDLRQNQIGDDGARCLSAAMENMVNLQVLNLRHNRIGSEGCQELSEALKQCTKLEHLNLESNHIGPQGCEAIAHGLKHCTKLEYLNLNSNQLGLEGAVVAMEMIHLQELHLSGNQLGDEGVEMAMEHFQELELSGGEGEAARAKPAMKKLYLYDCGIGDGGMKLLSTCMKKMVNLQELNLNDNAITDDGLQCLCSALEKLVNLQELYLRWNKLTDESVGPLTEMIKTAKCLKELYLFWNQFTEEGATELREATEERNRYPGFVGLEIKLFTNIR